MKRYDRPGTFFYLDPPYFGSEDYYGDQFSRDDFAQLAEALSGIQGKFLLSLNDVPEVQEIFKAFTIKSVATTYSVASEACTPAREVFIRNK